MATPHTPNVNDHLSASGARQGVAVLRRHQLRLLYGGGSLLTLLIVIMAALGALARWREFATKQEDVFQAGQAAISQALSQGNRGAINITNISDAIWVDQQDRLLSDGRPMVPLFLAQHGVLAISGGGSRSLPWLVLERTGAGISGDTLAKYLGATNQHSLLAAWTVLFSNDKNPFVYAYDPTASLFLISGAESETKLIKSLGATSRDEALAKLVAIDQEHRAHASFATAYGGRISYALATNPMTGEPSLFTSVSLQADGKEYLRRVFFQSLAKISTPLAQATQNAFRVITRDGDTVFETGAVPSALDNKAIAAFFKRHATSTSGGKTLWHGMGVPVVAGSVPDTGWIVLHPYTGGDLWRDLAPSFLALVSAAALSVAGLWLLLLRIDRRGFRPALAEAARVYESEALNRIIIETSSVGLCLVDATNGALIVANRSIRDVIGGGEFTAAHPCHADLVTHLREADRGDRTREWSMTATWPDGQVHQLEVTATPARHQEKPVWLCAFRDITAQREFEENLERARRDAESARQAAESASHAKSAFVAGMSHEIRTPLHGILGHLELLSHSPLEPSQRERLTRMRQSADVLLNTISDVLDFSKIEAGQLDIVHAPFALRSLVESTALLFAPQATGKGLALYYHIDLSLDETCVSDAHRISQILNNLLSNAVKFTASGRISLNAVRRDDDDCSWICFEVIDSGIGLTTEQQARLFEPFTQADSYISRRYGGTGLGLALSRQLAQRLGGRIEVQSTLGAGSRFTLRVPLVRAERSEHATPDVTLEGIDIVVLASAVEWRNEFCAFLASKGAHVIPVAHPSEMESIGAMDGALLLVVDEPPDSSTEFEVASKLACRRVIRASVDGPLVPEHWNGEYVVSCYASEAWLAAIKLDAAPAECTVRASHVAPRHEGKVLLVEDHPANRELIRQQLESLGFTVDEAENGIAALKLWRSGSYDVLLTDLNMPRMNGYELTRAVRKEDVTTPILAITASALASEREQCREAGITELLLKPLSLAQIEDAMRRHVSLRHASRRPSSPSGQRSTAVALPEKIRAAFVQRGREDLAAMQIAMDAGDMAALKELAHSFKGALLMLKESDVAEQCSELEARLHDGKIDGTGEMLAALLPALHAVVARYENVSGPSA